MLSRLLPAVVLLMANVTHAAVAQTTADAEFAQPTPRETFLAAAVALMMGLALTSFFLAGRITDRVQGGLGLLAVLIGGFCLFVLYGLAGHEYPAAGALVVIGLIGMFKLINQFEIRRKSNTP